MPVLEAFNSGPLIISAGFDAHHLAPLARLNFTDDDFTWITEALMKVSHACCGGKVEESNNER